MADVAEEPRPTEYNARSIKHCYINTPVELPITGADIRYIWQNHTVDDKGKFVAMGQGGLDYTVKVSDVLTRTVEPSGLPKLTVAQIAAYVKQLGYETLEEYETKTGVFAPPPEIKPATETETVTEGVK